MEVHSLPPGLLPVKGWLRRHAGLAAVPTHLAVKRGLGWRIGLLPVWGTCPFPCHQQLSSRGPPLARAVPLFEVGSRPYGGLRT